jgi:BirA family biotin operon repressor/biotin-[acetyl-CoA-carboxylase] ligase
VRPLLRTAFVVRLEGGRATGSTNDDARSLAVEGAAEGTVVLAASQTSGRGRLGREWVSPEGGVYASIVLRPSVQTPDAVVLPLVVGLGVARGLDRLGVSALLKWPNDLLSADGRKIAGVLLEGLSEGWRIDWVVAGVGVNMRSAPDPCSGVSVDELTGSRVPLAEGAAAVLDGIGSSYRRWQAEGFAPFAAEYWARSYLAGRGVRVSDAVGRLVAEGGVTGIDGLGRLLVETDAGTVRVVAGDVTLREQ